MIDAAFVCYLAVTLIGYVLIGLAFIEVRLKRQEAARKRPALEGPALEVLKNALLTQALMTVRTSDFSDDASDVYDGTKLPPLRGADWTHATLSYMDEGIQPKLAAIDRYLERNLSTAEQVMKFLDNLETLNDLAKMHNN